MANRDQRDARSPSPGSSSRGQAYEPEPGTLIVEDGSLRHGFVQIPRLVLYARNISRHAKLLYAVLLGYAWQEQRCFPGYSRLCDDLQASENSVRSYMRELEAAGLLAQKRRGLGKTNLYILPDLRTAKIEVLDPQFSRTSEPEVLEPQVSQAPEPQVSQDIIETEEGDSEEIESDNSNIRKGHPGKAEKGSAHTKQTAPEPKLDATSPSKGPESVGAVLSRRTGARRSTSRPRPETETDEYQRIQVLITDRAREFADGASLKASTTRAWNLYQAAGQSISTFESKLFQARALTQEATSRITNTVEDATYRTRRKSKMAYFFATLEDLLGLRPHDPEPEPEANPPTASAPEAAKPRRAKRTKAAPAEPETLPLDLTLGRRADDGELSGLWRGVLSELARLLTKSTYNQWLAPTRLVAITDEVAIVAAVDERAADWLSSRMASRIQPMLSSRAGRPLDLRFQVERGGE